MVGLALAVTCQKTRQNQGKFLCTKYDLIYTSLQSKHSIFRDFRSSALAFRHVLNRAKMGWIWV